MCIMTVNKYSYRISLINAPGVVLFSLLKSKCFVLNNATVRYYLRVRYYFYTYLQAELDTYSLIV